MREEREGERGYGGDTFNSITGHSRHMHVLSKYNCMRGRREGERGGEE